MTWSPPHALTRDPRTALTPTPETPEPVPDAPKPAPKHRGDSELVRIRRRAVQRTAALSGAAVTATGLSVAVGVLGAPGSADSAVLADGLHPLGAPIAAEPTVQPDLDRAPSLSRAFDRRQAADPAKRAALATGSGPAVTRTEDIAAQDPRSIALALLGEFGFSSSQMGCLDSLWTRESGWRVNADNPYSSAYGIPQALPGSKMASAGADWATNPATQIRWGLGYIRDRYGSPCGAWAHSQSSGWY